MVRAWGFWTRGKLELLSDYLDAFSTASKGVSERIYLDLFAGGADNVEKHTGELIRGSAEVALDVDDPPFTRLRFIELEHAEDLRSAFAAKAAGRDVKVHQSDCNEIINDVLAELAPWRWAPTFAFLDPNGPDYRWPTVEALADFMRGKRYKVELPDVRDRHSGRGSTKLASFLILRPNLRGDLEPREARDEYVKRWRFESELGNPRGRPYDSAYAS